jgi:hypothetical protein
MHKPKKRNKVLSLMQKIGIKIRYGMVLQVIKNRIGRLGIDIVPYIFFQEGTVEVKMPEIKGSVSDYQFEFLGQTDMKTISESNSGFMEEEYLGFLADGGICLGMKLGNQIAAFMWINIKERGFKETIIPLKSDEAYLWNMYTMESFRGINLAPYLRYKSYELLKGMGRDKLYSISEYFNTPAIKFKLKLNAKRLRLGLYIKLFKKYHWDITLRSYL